MTVISLAPERTYELTKIDPPTIRHITEVHATLGIAAGAVGLSPRDIAARLAGVDHDNRRHGLDALDDAERWLTNWRIVVESARARVGEALSIVNVATTPTSHS